jgi:hypothetical protein
MFGFGSTTATTTLPAHGHGHDHDHVSRSRSVRGVGSQHDRLCVHGRLIACAVFSWMLPACTLDLAVGRVPATQDASDTGASIDAAEADAAEPDAAEPDAGTSEDSGTMDAGFEMRTLVVTATPTIMCADSLGGREVDFAAIRAPDVQLAGGTLDYRLSSLSVILSGPVLEAAFETAQLILREDQVPDQPPGTFLAAVPIDFGALGPDDTRVNVAAVFIDTLQDPPLGEAGFQYETTNADGACFLSFSIVLLPP